MSQLYFVCCFVFPRLVGQEFIFPACHWLSQREKRWLLKQHILPLTCLLPTEHVISHHNSGLLLQLQQSAWPGAAGALRHISDDRRMAHNKNTDGVSFELFFMCWHGYHTKCKASDACYRWQKTVDGTCICLPAWHADNPSVSIELNKPVSESAATTRLSLCFVPQSCFLCAPHFCKWGKINTLMHSSFSKLWQCSIHITSDAKNVKAHYCQCVYDPSKIHKNFVKWQNIKNNNFPPPGLR